MADTKRPLSKPPPTYLTRENAVANLKKMMPPPGYGEGGGGVARNLPGGNRTGGGGDYQLPWLPDANNAARPPAPPPMLSPNPPTAVPQRDIPNVASTYHSPQDKPGYNEEGNRFDPSTNPGAFLSGDQYRAIPPSVPAPVRAYMGSNPTTGMKKGGAVSKPKWRRW
jgi:hypothetical protein